MSISIDLNVSLLANYLGLSSDKVRQYKNKDIKEVLELEAREGNDKVPDFITNVLGNANELVKLLQLTNTYNRLKIIRNLSSKDLLNLLPHLEKDDMLSGMQYFTKEKLYDMIKHLPKAKILSITARAFSLEKYMQMMSDKSLNEFLKSDKIQKSNSMKFVEYLQKPALQQMLEAAKGEPCKTEDTAELLKEISGLSERQYKKGLLALDKDEKTDLVTNLIKDERDLIFEFSQESLEKPLEKLEKNDLIANMEGLKPDDLVKMLKELPEDILQIIATQVDPKVFAEFLKEDFKDILEQITVSDG